MTVSPRFLWEIHADAQGRKWKMSLGSSSKSFQDGFVKEMHLQPLILGVVFNLQA